MVKNTQRIKDNEERLIGWLVSYERDEMGFAYEIRSGRALITADENVDGRFLTVPDRGVSSPHAALKANSKHKVLVQDIFSEQGSYITKGDSAKEVPLNGPTKLEHGDWIRIGNKSRFQVCLIDGSNR